MKHIPVRSINAIKHELDIHSENFKIREVRDLLGGKDLIQKLHRHDFFYILALEKATGSHEIDFIPYKVSDHSVFILRPGQVHELTLKAGSRGYLVAFKPDFYFPRDKASNHLLRKVTNKSLCQLDANRFKKLHAILTSIFQEYNDKQEGYLDVIKASLGIFFIELVRYRQKRNSASSNVAPYTQERLDKFLELLETHISTHKQVSEYADMLNLSAYQLNAITKKMLGKTCSELISEHIILEAKRYLLVTDNQVSQVADYLGYDDVSYFIRFFKKHTGYTPEVFRNNFT